MAVLAATLLLGGCTLGVQDRPVPFDATSTATPSSTVSDPGDVWRVRSVEVFLVHDDRLIKVHRDVAVQAGERPAVAALVSPVTESEAHEGLRTALPTPIGSLEVTLDGKTARVGLPKGFDDIGVPDQILGVAQIVYTLTAVGGVDAVQFIKGGEPVAVPNGAGRLMPGPVDRSDYAVIAP